MTFILTVNGPETIWMLADRRLSANGHVVKDDACKIMSLETTDGAAILGYAGLGATARGNQPSDWMAGVLRNINMPLEPSLGQLAMAMDEQFPSHMVQMGTGSAPVHNLIVPAFVGDEATLYTIDIALGPDRKTPRSRYVRHVTVKPGPLSSRPPRITLGGSGGFYLNRQNKSWKRELLRVIEAHERRRVSPHTVADHLAALNERVHHGVQDNSVGPRCIVAWRHKVEGTNNSGLKRQYYTGTVRESDVPLMPMVVRGFDLTCIVNMPHFRLMTERMKKGEPPGELNKQQVDAEAALYHRPDKRLR